MKFSESWLRESVNLSLSAEALVAQLTMAGLEVDGIEAAGPRLSGVVVGEIISVEQHPDADKLRVCQVMDGQQHVQVVCGAPNARVGIKVPFAQVGAILPGDFKIKKAKLRGIESFGMLCAQDELALGEDTSGLWELPLDASVGVDLVDYLNLTDNIFEVDLTPNRGDCLSLRGLTREVGVLNQTAVLSQDCAPVAATIGDKVAVNIKAPKGCARYVGRVIKGLDLSQVTPQWMQEKLRRSGIRSLGPAVDITNYVLLELGQPMHAFDLSKIDGSITVRMGGDEHLQLLDDSAVTVNNETLVIADDSKVLALAGIMGGAESSVGQHTQDILLESAWFNPLTIAGKARHYGKHTDSSHRFERGVDHGLQVAAIERATALMLDICGGSAGPCEVQERSEYLPAQIIIRLRDSRLSQQLGVDIAAQDVDAMLTRLGLVLLNRGSGEGIWSVPSWRFDLTIEQDLVEEVARIYGYNNLPTSTPVMAVELKPSTEVMQSPKAFRSQLIARGYQEVITYSFIDPDLQKIVDPDVVGVPLVNPISADMAVMRTNLWSGLLATTVHNLNRQQARVRIFEIGQCFIPDAGSDSSLTQALCMGGLICGSRAPAGWASGKDAVDFYDIKGDIEAVFEQTGLAAEFVFEVKKNPALHPGQSAVILRNGIEMGWIGQLHPKLQKHLGLPSSVFLFHLNFNQLTEVRLPKYKDVSKFPEVKRDLAFFVESSTEAQRLMDVVRDVAGTLLVDLKLFDVYQGKDIDNKGKSVALGLTFQHESRTLTDDEINKAIDTIVAELGAHCGAELRG
jgi:phenylalanyl-tRNA synthetase beta chain